MKFNYQGINFNEHIELYQKVNFDKIQKVYFRKSGQKITMDQINSFHFD